MCEDLGQFDVIAHDLNETAGNLGSSFDPDHLHLIPWDTDTFWTRDYGPWWIHNRATGRYAIAKHSYTTLGGGSVGLVEGAEKVPPTEGLGIFRPNDDYGAVKLSDFLDAPIRAWNSACAWERRESAVIDDHDWFFLGLLDVGGNYMVTGKGILASSYLVATQNEVPVTKEKEITHPDQHMLDERMTYILEQMNRFLGVHTYHVLADPTGTYIGHIDCWGKFLSDDKVLIAHSQDKKIDEHFDTISESFSAEGFTVYRVMCQHVYVPSAVPPRRLPHTRTASSSTTTSTCQSPGRGTSATTPTRSRSTQTRCPSTRWSGSSASPSSRGSAPTPCTAEPAASRVTLSTTG